MFQYGFFLNSGYKKGNWEEKIATVSMQRILHVQQTDPLLLTSYLAVPFRKGVVDGVKFLVVVRRKIDLAKTGIRLYRKSTERASLSVHVTQTNIPILSKN